MKLSKRTATQSTPVTRKPKPSKLSSSMPDALAGLLRKLKGYQRKSLQHVLVNPFAGVLLDPGLGKTLVILAAFWILKHLKLVDILVVIAPLRPAFQVWPKEIKKWGIPFSYAILHEDGDGRRDEIPDRDILIINYEGLAWLHPMMETLTKRGVCWLVPDESTKLKNNQSLRHRWADAIADCFGRRVILTGTPIPKGYIDLWGQMKIVDRGKRLGWAISHYRRWFLSIDETGAAWSNLPDPETKKVRRPPKAQRIQYIPTTEGTKEIERRVADCLIWFSDADLGLPPWLAINIEVELPPKARKIYDALERDFNTAVDIEGEGAVLINATNSGVLGQKLRQVANGGIYDEEHRHIFIHDEKSVAVVDYFEELSGKALMVAFEFNHDKERLVEAFRKEFGSTPPAIDGKTKVKEGNRLMESFNNGHEDLLLVQSTMMEGLNLQEACHNVCWHSLTWRADCYIQLIKRVHRLGQKHKVKVAHVIAKNTKDEKVWSVCRGRVITQTKFLKAIRSIRG